MRTYVWTEFRLMMIAYCCMVAIGTCNIIPNYGILTEEVRAVEDDESVGEYLGGI